MSFKAIPNENESLLILELERNCRLPLSMIARKIGVSFELARYKVQKLCKKGIITSFLTLINFAQFGFDNYCLILELKHLEKGVREEIISFFTRNPHTTNMSILTGKYDLQVNLLARDHLQFNQVLTAFLDRFGNFVFNKEIELVIYRHYFEKKYFVQKKIYSQLINYEISSVIGGKKSYQRIDQVDVKILKLLSTNATMSNSEIGRKIHTPPSTVILRIKKLLEHGIILGFSALIQPQKYNYKVYLIFIKLCSWSQKIEQELYNFCQVHPNTTHIYKLIGRWDYEIKIEVANVEEFSDFIEQFKHKFPNLLFELDFVMVLSSVYVNLFPAVLWDMTKHK